MKLSKIIASLLVVATVLFAFAACKGGETPADTTKAADVKTEAPAADTTAGQAEVDTKTKSEGVLTYEQYIATENGKDVVIEGFLQAKYEYSEAYKNTSLYLADGDGAYFVYRYATTPEDYAKLEVGAKLRITGTKDQWSGETEVKDVTKLEVVGTDKWIADPVDVTATIGSDAVAADNNKAVVIKGAVVAASKIKDDAKEYAFLYKHDGSGAQGDDIYFNVTVGGKDYTFVVESDFSGKDSEIYKAVEALKIGDKIDIGGFLYWYNAPQVQVTSVAASK